MSQRDAEEGKPLLSPINNPQDQIAAASDAAVTTPAAAAKTRGKNRLVSLDATRGLTVMVMIFVDNTGDALQGHVNHSPWDHVTFADFVMPFFLFMVGMSMSLSMRKYKSGLAQKVFWRTVKLFVLGLLTQGGGMPKVTGGGFDLKRIRVPGILQRIAWAYGVVALMAMALPRLEDTWARSTSQMRRACRMFRIYAWHWVVGLTFFFIYVIFMFGVTVPSWSLTLPKHRFDPGPYPDGCVVSHDNSTVTCTINCNVRGDLTPKCSAARAVDLWVLGYDHMYGGGEFVRLPECSGCSPGECPLPAGQAPEAWCYGRLDPEGVLASIPCVLTTWLGLFFGFVLLHYKEHGDRLRMWITLSLVFFFIGIIIELGGWHMNKQLWSPSYLFMNAGSTGFFAIFFYVCLDYREWQPSWLQRGVKIFREHRFRITSLLRPFVWVGMNTIFIYLFSPAGGLWERIQSFFFWDKPENNTVELGYTKIFCGTPNPICPTGVEECRSGGCGPLCESYICDGGIFDGHPSKYAVVLFTLGRIAFWTGVAGVLHAVGWYWAL